MATSAVLDRSVFLLLLFVLTFVTGLTARLFKKNDNVFGIIVAASCGFLMGTGIFLAVPEGISSLLKGSSGITPDNGGAEKMGNNVGAYIGLGFCVIFILDQVVNAYSRSLLKRNVYSQERLMDSSIQQPNLSKNSPDSEILITTIGLSAHSIIDGLIVGTLFTSQKGSSIFFGVFSIVVHKFPTSFGLATFLISRRVSKLSLIGYLSLFSISTPISALMTSSIISSKVSPDEYNGVIGKLLLVSSGTFIYTACTHVFAEAFYKKEDITRNMDEVNNIQQTPSEYTEAPSSQASSHIKIETHSYMSLNSSLTEVKTHLCKIFAFSFAFVIPLVAETIFQYVEENSS